MRLPALALLLSLLPPALSAQAAPDSAAIRATALDYIDGWYTNDAARMERALHGHLAKRLVVTDAQGHSRLVDMTALELIQGTRSHLPVPASERREEVAILSIFGNAAVVRIDAGEWVDFLELVRWNGRWVILNVVWENRPSP
jgi:hypothetical protein